MSKNEIHGPSLKEEVNLLQIFNDGDSVRAERIALSLTQKFPNHQFGWKVLGALFKNKGDFSKSLEANKKSLELNPQDPEAFNNLGNSLLGLVRFEEAKECYKKAIAIDPKSHAFHASLGMSLTKLGKYEEAIESFKNSIMLKDDIAENHCTLGNIEKIIGRNIEAEESYKRAIALKPETAYFYTLLGLVQREFGRYVDAETSYRKTLALDSENALAHYNLGILLFEHRHYKEAASHFHLTEEAHSKSFELKCYYLLDEQSIFYKHLDNMINEGRSDAVIGSMSCRSEIRYGIKKQNPFCNNPLKYVSHTNLNENYDFNNIFVKNTKIILDEEKLEAKSQGLITNGYQTSGNLFHHENEEIIKIKNIINSEIKKYLTYHKDSNEGIITRWTENYTLHGWLISMKSGGKLSSHMHDNGWLSGSVYINVPEKLETDSGNLVVCIEEDQINGENQMKSIDVVTGSLCLFPSSLLHHTIPFKSQEERIVLAFDVVRNKSDKI